MRPTFQFHPNIWLILPSLVLMEHRCEDPQCDTLHGWSLELGWLWWSVGLESVIPE